MGRGILRGAGGDENLKSNFIWPYLESSDHDLVSQGQTQRLQGDLALDQVVVGRGLFGSWLTGLL